MEGAAVFSEDGLYRWWLSRIWGKGTTGVVTFVLLNPSTADATHDDATIRRCIGFAKAWGHRGMTVVNAYALRSTDPRGLWRVDDPVGSRNDGWLRMVALDAALYDTPIVAAWGTHARPDRVAAVRALPHMERLSHLGLNQGGSPKHPLRLRADTPLQPWV